MSSFLERLRAMPDSTPCGSLAGVPIRLHMMFWMVLIMQLLGSIHYGGWAVLLWFILLGPVLLLTVALHELGHCLAARSVGAEVHGILLWPLGGLAFIGKTPSPKADMWVAVAGPLTHVPQVVVWVLLLLPFYHANTGSWRITLSMPPPNLLGQAVCVGAIIMNISLFAFNLLCPAYPLDGGRILADLLLAAGMEPRRAAIVTAGVAAPLAVGVLVYGCVEFQMVTIMVALFIGYATFQLIQAIRNGTVSQHPLFASSAEEVNASPYAKFDTPGPNI